MSTLKTHNLQSPDSGSSNIALTPNAGMVVTGISTFSNNLDINANIDVSGTSTLGGNISGTGDLTLQILTLVVLLDPNSNSSEIVHHLLMQITLDRLSLPEKVILV